MTEAEKLLFSIGDRLLPVARSAFPSLSLPEQTRVLVWGLEAEVNNGGFNQYFFNSAGDRSADTVTALRRILEYRYDLSGLLHDFVMQHRSDVRGA